MQRERRHKGMHYLERSHRDDASAGLSVSPDYCHFSAKSEGCSRASVFTQKNCVVTITEF